MIEHLERWFHHLEIRRDVKIARREQAMVTDVQDIPDTVDAPGILASLPRDLRQDRILDRLERARDERGTNGPGRLATP